MAKNVSHYNGIMESLLVSDAGIGKFSSYIVLGTPIIRDGYPIDRLFN